MSSGLSQTLFVSAALFVVLLSGTCFTSRAQTDDLFGDSGADPIKLFERGQSAHARGDLEKALEFYEQALKVKPEFPEAEFQRGNALAALGKLAEAEGAFRRAIAQKKNWSLPHSALGALLMRSQRDSDPDQSFRSSITMAL